MNHTSKIMNHFWFAIIISTASCQGHDDEHDHHGHGSHGQSNENWAYGMLATIGVSLLGFVISAIILCLSSKKESIESPLKALIAFAVGCLLGDAFLHLIPHSFHDHGSHDDHESVLEEEQNEESESMLPGVMLVLGFAVFYVIEKVMFLLINKSNSIRPDQQNNQREQQRIPVETGENNQEQEQEQSSPQEKELTLGQQLFTREAWKNKTSVGYLNLVSDMLHNILDGLAIGILFSGGDYGSAAKSLVAIVLHEVAQEIGDTCILIQEGFYPYQTLMCNGVVNLSALVGAVIGLSLGSLEQENLLTMFVAGNFIYLGAVDLLPEIQKEKSVARSLVQGAGLVVGFTTMGVIGILEH